MGNQSNREIEIFNSALERGTLAERAAYLDGACDQDAALRATVETLIRAHEQAGGFLAAEDAKPRAAGLAKTIAMSTGMFPVTEKAGDRIGHYKLREKIGEGGCGVVYVADQEAPVRRRVALKVIKLGMDTKSVIARFEAERQALAMMDHPNIAKVLDAGATDAGRPYFVMELVRGIKITDYCDQNKLTTRERLDLFIKVCQAIQHAHQKGIIHRDIKPSNILVTLHDGVPVPKIIDFGISKATEGRLTDLTVYTELHQFIGTPAYMSPEQAEMSGLDIDTRADIYSLGVLLYELLTGGTPFNAHELVQSGLDAMRKTIREIEPVRPSTKLSTMLDADLTAVAQRHGAESPKLVHLIRGDLDWIVMKSLEKDRTRRYETANGLAMDIQRHLTNEPIIARPPSTFYRFQKMVRRNKLAFAAAGAVAAAVVLGLVFSSWEAIRATKAQRDERSARVAAEQSQTREAEQRKLADANARKATSSEQNARSLLYAADMRLVQQAWEEGNLSRMTSLLEAHRPKPGEADERGFEYFYFENLAKGEQEAVLYHATNAVLGAAISPDGKWLASRTATEVRLWDLASKTPAAAFARPATMGNAFYLDLFDEYNASFSHDGQYLSIATETGLQIYHIPTHRTLNLSTGPVEWAAFSPVTNMIAFNSGRASSGKGRVWDYEANKEIITTITKTAFCWSPDGTRLVTGRWNSRLESFDTSNWSSFHINDVGEYLTAVAVSTNDGLMAAADWQGKVHLLKISGTNEFGTIDSGDVRASALAFSPDGKLLATGSGSQTIQIWDTTTLQRVQQLRGHHGRITSLSFTPDGRTLASTSTDGDVRLWNPTRPTGDLRMENGLDSFGWESPVFSRDGHRLGLLMKNNQSLVLDVPTLQVSGIVAGEIASFSPDGKQLATLGSDFELQLWKTGADFHRARIHLDRVTVGVSQMFIHQFSPGDNALALYIGQGKNMRAELYDAGTGDKIFSPDWTSEIPAGCFSPDGRTWIYSVGSEIKFFDLQPHAHTRTLNCNAAVNYLTVSPDGKTLAASQADDAISLWDLERGVQLGTLPGHQANVFSLAFSNDGRTLASGSEDRTVKLWHIATQRELASFTQEKAVYWLAFSPDNQILVAGGVGFYHFLRAPRDEAVMATVATTMATADLPTNSIWRVPDGVDRTPPRMAAEQDQCFTNMLKISAAIMAYRNDHQQMPDWLSDLVPKYLSDTNCLICPVCARTGEKPDLHGMDDPKIASSYYYEFNAHTNVWTDQFGVAAPGDTMKAWKEKQLAHYGPVVPVVRCPMHPQFQSVTYAGERRVDKEQGWENAVERTLQLEQATGTNAEWFNDAAWELVKAKDASKRNPAQAVKLAERAVELTPTDANFWNTLGVALYRNGEFKQAIGALEKSVQLGNGGPANYDPTTDFIVLAMASHQLGNEDATGRYYSQAVQRIKSQKQLNWDLLPFQIEARNLLGPALIGQTEFETLTPAAAK